MPTSGTASRRPEIFGSNRSVPQGARLGRRIVDAGSIQRAPRRKAPLAIVYADLGKTHLQFGRAGQREGTAPSEDLQAARECLAKSLSFWNELRARNALAPINRPRLQETEQAMAECNAALQAD